MSRQEVANTEARVGLTVVFIKMMVNVTNVCVLEDGLLILVRQEDAIEVELFEAAARLVAADDDRVAIGDVDGRLGRRRPVAAGSQTAVDADFALQFFDDCPFQKVACHSMCRHQTTSFIVFPLWRPNSLFAPSY